ncbi:FecR domain-containing protein [Sphingomonas sp. QA11]|uniref:FecR family protein n=1 Tax=Sphingomonas sp. QA11 TaxID=2950605 RepID=UPI002348FF14|nr:FecR domain-containing protein [Sphingomonas sp. QA11]WCM28015.1 FecR domain-containing protein [Sphingomonas sp. QA11]
MTEGTRWTDAELARLRLEGLDHLTHLRSGTATEHDAVEFVAWRMRSRAHEEAFRSAVRLSRRVREADAANAARMLSRIRIASNDTDNVESVSEATVVSLNSAAHARLSRRGLIGGALAASFAGGVLLLGRSMDLVPSASELRADYRTGTGERRLVQLADGANVELNTRTSIGLRPDMTIPAIELISGEAIVTNGRSGKAALVAGQGTSIGSDGHFNARRDGDDVCITCLEGQVEVDWSGEKRLLNTRNQVRYNDTGIGAILSNVDTTVVSAWKVGTLIFRDMPMPAVINEINRYRPGRVFLANKQLAARSLTGTYYMNRLDEFFSQAELALGAKITRLPGNVVILS